MSAHAQSEPVICEHCWHEFEATEIVVHEEVGTRYRIVDWTTAPSGGPMALLEPIERLGSEIYDGESTTECPKCGDTAKVGFYAERADRQPMTDAERDREALDAIADLYRLPEWQVNGSGADFIEAVAERLPRDYSTPAPADLLRECGYDHWICPADECENRLVVGQERCPDHQEGGL